MGNIFNPESADLTNKKELFNKKLQEIELENIEWFKSRESLNKNEDFPPISFYVNTYIESDSNIVYLKIKSSLKDTIQTKVNEAFNSVFPK